MPSMANITVKNAAGTDVVLVAKVPAAGDRSPARWTLDTASAIVGNRPVLEVTTRESGKNPGRIMSVSYTTPVVQTKDGIVSIVARVPMTLAISLPTNVDGAAVNDAYVIGVNALASALMKSVAETGYAPT